MSVSKCIKVKFSQGILVLTSTSLNCQKIFLLPYITCSVTFLTFSSFGLRTADKYNKAGYLTLRERLARINTHSIAKKTARLSRLFMHEAGIVTKVSICHFALCPGTECSALIWNGKEERREFYKQNSYKD